MNTISKLFIFATALIGMFSMSSCTDLDPVDYSDINPSTFPQSNTDIESMVNACYYSVRSSWFDGLYSPCERGVMCVNDLTTEILSASYGFQKDMSDLNYTTSTADLTRFYYTDTDGYSDGWLNDISRCTSVIAQIEAADFLTEEMRNHYLAEVRCVRGHLSYVLYDMFGPLSIAPIEVLNSPTVEQPIARLSEEEMTEFIEEDLLFAAEHLPSPSNTEYGRFSNGFAKMLLIRLYLHETPRDNSYYTKVEEQARDLMTSAYGYELEESYTEMFEVGGQGTSNTDGRYL